MKCGSRLMSATAHGRPDRKARLDGAPLPASASSRTGWSELTRATYSSVNPLQPAITRFRSAASGTSTPQKSSPGAGSADVVLLAREALRDPSWPLHAAARLEPETVGDRYPHQYLRAVPPSTASAR